MEAYSGTQAQPAGDMISIPGLEAEDRKSPAVSLCIDSWSWGQGDLEEQLRLFQAAL